MRVRVSFRYNTQTGEVEVFQVDDAHDGPARPDHDARHDAATRSVARVVAAHPTVSEVPPGEAIQAHTVTEPAAEPGAAPRTEAERRLHD